MIILTISVMALFVIPFERESLISGMNSTAEAIATSVGQVVAQALVLEDYSFVVDHCLKVVLERPGIDYVVITRNDGFSLISTEKGWNVKTLSGMWLPPERTSSGEFIKSDLTNKTVYNYSFPFTYSGINWGWIHIGLSPERFYKDLKAIYRGTFWVAFLCIFLGLGFSYLFARRLSQPIFSLTDVTQKVAKGDLTARASISTGDELEILAESFNKMTEALQRSREELISARDYAENIIKSMTDALIVLDPSGSISSINKATLDLLKYEKEEMIGKKISELFSPHTVAKLELEGRGLLDFVQRYPQELYEMTFITKGGERIPILFSASIMRNKKGELDGLLGVAKDITKMRASEEELKRLNEQLRRNEQAVLNILADLKKSHGELKSSQEQLLQSEKLASLGRLVSDMAHEVNNPLQIISGRAQLSLMSEDLNAEIDENLKIIMDQCERAKDVIHRLLLFSRPSKGEMKEVNINDVVVFVVKLLEHQYSLSNIEIVRDYADSLHTVRIDEKQMHEVFMNLLRNSGEAMPGGGRISITTSRAEDKKVRVDISDTGTGIKKEDMNKIFDPFFTTKEHGTGLGLSVCYGIVKAHGGELTYVSKQGKGTTATIILPVVGG
ncbi:MAG: ATP-binding protein [Candidatus Omnitrophota bacterium]